MKHVKDVIEGRELISATPDATVLEIARTMSERRIGAVPVLEGTRLVGIFTERDLMTRVVTKELSAADTRVSEVMTPDVASANPGDPLPECIERMQASGYRHLPVLDGDVVVGVISLRDLLQVDRLAIRHQKEVLSELVTDTPIYDV